MNKEEIKYWTTKDGTKIKIEDMETSHIKNSIKCLQEGRVKAKKRISAPDFEESEYLGFPVREYLEIDLKQDYIDALRNELKQRGEW